MSTLKISVESYFADMDSRAMPRYTFGEAARYLGLPESTLRAWFLGTTYGSHPYVRQFKPFLVPASSEFLSFYDIASVHVLMALKSKGVRPEDIRLAVDSVRMENPSSRYPLLGMHFFMFGKEVIIKKLGQRLNLTRGRQYGLKAVMDKFLDRLEVDSKGMPLRFNPLKGKADRVKGKGLIVIDPDLSSGRPVIKGTGIAAEVISKRKKSGESLTLLARDYRVSVRAIKEAVRYFETAKAA
jgi:uncharacterized protein (DUF433 family)